VSRVGAAFLSLHNEEQLSLICTKISNTFTNLVKYLLKIQEHELQFFTQTLTIPNKNFMMRTPYEYIPLK